MAVVADRVIVELEARLDRYEANVARADAKFDRAMGNIQKSAGATERFVSRSMAAIGGAFAGVSLLAMARGFLSIADSAKQMDSQLRLATAGFGSFSKAQEDAQRIAQSTRSGLEETTKLYGNILRNAKDLGITQAEAARATETVAKTFKISGAGAVEAAQGTRQLVQALQSGVLRGDEFNSVMESSPRLTKLLADSLGIPIGQLRAMAEEGELTSDKLVQAFTDTKFTAGIDAEFRQIPVTFDDAMTQVTNAATITFGAFDHGGEFSKMLANFVTDGGKGFADLSKSAEAFGQDVRAVMDGLAATFGPFLSAGQEAFAILDGIAQKFGTRLQTLLNWTNPIGAAINIVGDNKDFQEEQRLSKSRAVGRAAGEEHMNRRRDFYTAIGMNSGRTGQDWLLNPPAQPSSVTTKDKKSKKLKTPKGKTVQTLEEWMNETAIEVSNDVLVAANSADPNLDNGAYDEAIRQVERKAEIERELRREIDDEAFRRQESQIQTLAGLFENAMLGGTGNIWDSFKRIGIRVIAEIAAKFAVMQANGQGSGNIFKDLATIGSAVAKSNVGFAGGGSGVIGGRGGTDTNVLSLNGRPLANVTRGETLSVGNKALAGRGGGAAVYQTFVLDARYGVTTPELIDYVNRTARAEAVRAGSGAFVAGQKATPGTIDQYNKLAG